MKKLTILIILVCIIQATATSQSCLPEVITFETQAQIDSFQINYPNCTEIEGGVLISGWPESEITNLNGLNVVTVIRGSLFITYTDSLVNLTGLDNLSTIGGDLKIYLNDALIDLEGLGNLYSISGRLMIGCWDNAFWPPGNKSLVSLEGLNNLTSIGEGINICSNIELTDITALSKLTQISGPVSLWSNFSLPSLSGLENIISDSIEYLYFVNNSSLTTCEIQSICEYLASPNGTVQIYDNASGCNSTAEVDTACNYAFVGENSILNKLQIHPNPFIQTVTIDYELNQPSTVQITIYNHFGKQIEIIQQNQSAGKQQFVWNAEGLPCGVYFCVLKTESGIQSIKMIKMK